MAEGIVILRWGNWIPITKYLKGSLQRKVETDGILSADEIATFVLDMLMTFEEVPHWLVMFATVARGLVKEGLDMLNVDWSTPLTEKEIERIASIVVLILRFL